MISVCVIKFDMCSPGALPYSLIEKKVQALTIPYIIVKFLNPSTKMKFSILMLPLVAINALPVFDAIRGLIQLKNNQGMNEIIKIMRDRTDDEQNPIKIFTDMSIADEEVRKEQAIARIKNLVGNKLIKCSSKISYTFKSRVQMKQHKKFTAEIEALTFKARKIAYDIYGGYPTLFKEALGNSTCSCGVGLFWLN